MQQEMLSLIREGLFCFGLLGGLLVGFLGVLMFRAR